MAAAPKEGLSYKAAGVDIDAGDELVKRIQKLNPSIGGFSGLVPFGDSYLVAGTDGVGTKLKLAFDMNKHDTVGIDLVAMSVNDIVTSGAQPLFFLDYYATGSLDVDAAEQVRCGTSVTCRVWPWADRDRMVGVHAHHSWIFFLHCRWTFQRLCQLLLPFAIGVARHGGSTLVANGCAHPPLLASHLPVVPV